MPVSTVEALERWLVEVELEDLPAETEPLIERLRELLAGPDGDDPRRWAELERRARRLARDGDSARARGIARALEHLIAGHESAIVLPAKPAVPRREPRITTRTGAIIGVAAVIALAGGVAAARALSVPKLDATGPAAGAQIGPTLLPATDFTTAGDTKTLRHQVWMLDGKDVTRWVRAKNGRLVLRPTNLAQGAHELSIVERGGFLGASAHARFDFTVDLTAPDLAVTTPIRGRAWTPLTVRGTVGDPRATVTVANQAVPITNGHWSVTLQPPVGAHVPVVATDMAGNRTVAVAPVSIVPRMPSAAVHAVHVTADGWANPEIHAAIRALIRSHRVNSVELDLKDESGVIGFGPNIAWARTIGASKPIYSLPNAVSELHHLGVRVIGRLVCFRDPIAAAAAWDRGAKSNVVQTPTGAQYSGYSGYLNFASPAVQRYLISIAVAASRAGVDDILYDYVRRPDGPIDTMAFPGLHGSAAQAIVNFLRDTHVAIAPYGTYLGVSVFGIAATRPDQVAHNIPDMAREVDFVSPMVYPSHWNPGEYDVADPNAQPGLIVKRSLVDFRTQVAGTGARLMPWLQAFNLGFHYGPKQVRDQIDAAKSIGINEFLLWNPDASYDARGLARNAKRYKAGLAAPAK